MLIFPYLLYFLCLLFALLFLLLALVLQFLLSLFYHHLFGLEPPSRRLAELLIFQPYFKFNHILVPKIIANL